MVGIAQIKNGLMTYATQHMMPAMDSKGQFVLGMGLGAAMRKAEGMLTSLTGSNLLTAAGYVKDGQVDLELMYGDAMSQMKRQGQLVWDVPLLGTLKFISDGTTLTKID